MKGLHFRVSVSLPSRTMCTSATNLITRQIISAGTVFQGESGRRYRLLSPLSPEKGRKPHVWKAVDVTDDTHQLVVKQPRSDDDEAQNFPAFQHEFRMQQRFRNAPFIRQMVDYAPASPSTNSMPSMVLQGFEKTLWTARLRRELSYEEIRWIMKGVLIGLWTVHREGLVHSGGISPNCQGRCEVSYITDLKMENVVMNGFDDEKPGDIRSIVARLADCGLGK